MEKFNLNRPCEECPFRQGQGYLRKERAEEIRDHIDPAGGDGHFHCHKTSYSGDGEVAEDEKSICAGSVIVALKEERPGQMLRTALRLRVVDPDELKDVDEVVGSFDEFVQMHREGKRPHASDQK